MKLKLIQYIIFGLALFSVPAIGLAHPHAWISMKTSFLFNEKGEVTGIREHWLFDKMYTAFALQDFDPNHNGKLDKDELMQLAAENLKGLKEFNYFTVMETEAGKPVTLNEQTAMDSYLEKEQIAIDFTLPLHEPLNMAAHQIVYRIYDPTYYIDMGHYEKEPVSFDARAPKSCKYAIARPSVDINLIASAAALDKNAKAPKDFGYSFAEKVTITCN
ncbi:MAG: DUF1007 family protein [Alphaproteobacteria bacterium]|nr:DUF1007 family protein [Alphaproteobacteria bacterium]